MTTVRDAMLPILDGFRGQLDTTYGLRRFDVLVRVVTWSGGQIGAGTKIVTDTPLLVGGGRPKVVHIRTRDVIASGGLYAEEDLRLGPLTPPDSTGAGGTQIGVFDPPVGASPAEVLFRLTGPGTSPTGDWYRKVSQETWGNFRFSLVLRKTGQTGV